MLKTFPCDRQLDMMDCGPACLKMIARYYGKYYSLQYLRERCGITREGVSFLDLSYASESIGIRTLSLKSTIDDLLEKVPLPVVIHWDNSHFIVVYKTNPKKGKIYVSDPAKGRMSYAKEKFAKHWLKKGEENGALIAVQPQADFYERRAEEKTGRKKTMENFIGYFRPYKKSFVNLIIVMLIVTGLQGLLPFISKAVIDVGVQTKDINFIYIVLIANVAIYVSILFANMVRDWVLLHVTSRVNIELSSFLSRWLKRNGNRLSKCLLIKEEEKE